MEYSSLTNHPLSFKESVSMSETIELLEGKVLQFYVAFNVTYSHIHTHQIKAGLECMQ